jgi:hypothetical protein
MKSADALKGRRGPHGRRLEVIERTDSSVKELMKHILE